MTESDAIKERARDLPTEYQQKVLDYIEMLWIDVKTTKEIKPSLTWAGGLSDVQEDVFTLH